MLPVVIVERGPVTSIRHGEAVGEGPEGEMDGSGDARKSTGDSLKGCPGSSISISPPELAWLLNEALSFWASYQL
jgi:hypothetical protein